MSDNDKVAEEVAGIEDYEAYTLWSKNYFGHGMPPSQNYYESTMSAFHAGAQYGYTHAMKERIDSLYKNGKVLYTKEYITELRDEIKELEAQLQGKADETADRARLHMSLYWITMRNLMKMMAAG